VNDDERFSFKPWDHFDPGQLKHYIETAWDARPQGCDTAEVAIVVNGNNPITGYTVILKPV
jgi:hypothetical protein